MAECTARVDRGGGRWSNLQPCGREAKEDGLCALHLRARRRKLERDQRYESKQERHASLEKRASELGQRLGVDVKPDFNPYAKGGGGYTEDVVIGYDDLLRLLGRLARMNEEVA